ncbi:MAG: O-antigen ligase family protein [Lentisphaerae bacterium]|nr:O-antigen ligase family protein [Lentisphaerota bacterium]
MNKGKLITLALIVAAFLAAIFVFTTLSMMEPAVSFVVVAGVFFLVWAFRSPKTALLAAVFLIPFERLTAPFPPTPGHPTLLGTLTFAKLMLAAILVVWLFKLLVTKDTRPQKMLLTTALPLLVMLFAYVGFLSLFMAGNLGMFIQYESRVINGIVFFFLVINIVDDRPTLYNLIRVCALSYVFIGLIGVFEAVTQRHLLTVLGIPLPENVFGGTTGFRILGPSGDPDFFACSIIFGLLMTIAAWQLVRGFCLKTAVLVVLGIHAFVILATGSRGAALALVVALPAFWFFIETRHKILYGTLAVFLTLSGITIYTFAFSKLAVARYIGATGSSSVDMRLGGMKMCLDMTLDSPLLGVGSGNFLAVYHQYIEPTVTRSPMWAQCTYTLLPAQNGIPALLLYLAILSVSAWLFYRAMRESRDPTMRFVALSMFCLLIAFSVFSGTLDTMTNEINWMQLALSITMWDLVRQEAGSPPDPAPASA